MEEQEEEVLVENGDERIDACTAGGASQLACKWLLVAANKPIYIAAAHISCYSPSLPNVIIRCFWPRDSS
ncbi:Fucose-specific lectin [Trichinella pseudospiralis]